MAEHKIVDITCPVCTKTVKREKRYKTCGNPDCAAEQGRRTVANKKEEAGPVRLINDLDDIRRRALIENTRKFLKKLSGKVNVLEIANTMDCSPKTVHEVLNVLREQGFNVLLSEDGHAALTGDVQPGSPEPLTLYTEEDYKGGMQLYGACGDNHLGSNHERLDVLNTLYDVYEDEGVQVVFNTGNWIEGEFRMNKHDIKVHGLDNQIDYFLEKYPQKPGITTYFVAGDDHEGWYQQRESLEIGRYAMQRAKAAGREDLIYLGYVEADVELKAAKGSAWMKVMHPGGGSAYALSYSAQKIVESFQGGEKPSVLLYGHYHKFDYNYAREVHCVGTGCTVDQSIFMRKQKIQAHVGGCLIRLNQVPEGQINRCQVEWLPFYDKSFYNKRNFVRGGAPELVVGK